MHGTRSKIPFQALFDQAQMHYHEASQAAYTMLSSPVSLWKTNKQTNKLHQPQYWSCMNLIVINSYFMGKVKRNFVW